MSNPNSEPTPEKILHEAFLKAANSLIVLNRQASESGNSSFAEGYRTCLLQVLAYIRNMERRMIRIPHSNLTAPFVNGEQVLKELQCLANSNKFSFKPRHSNHTINIPSSFSSPPSSDYIANRELKRLLRQFISDGEDNPFENEITKKMRRTKKDRGLDSDDDYML